ncbi:MAG: glycoside hydrolase family 16 protein, partial [Proteobacteria bacterium]|nr:glycoside hydrolase family 16 protein [Pseudomonadota bacterium]
MSRFVGLLCMSLSPLWCPSLVAKPWRSGEILSQQTFKYGAFEARIQASRGDGCISSFYLLKDESWIPGQEWQELDFEIFGKDGAFKYQTQIMTPGDPRTQHIVYHKQGQNLSDDFHVYRLEWTPDALIFFFDGKKVRTETDRVEYNKFLDASQVEAMRLRLG